MMQPDRHQDYQTFLCDYRFEGSEWSVEIPARSWEEAQARLKALAWGQIVGHRQMTLPGWLPEFVVRFIAWWKS